MLSGMESFSDHVYIVFGLRIKGYDCSSCARVILDGRGGISRRIYSIYFLNLNGVKSLGTSPPRKSMLRGFPMRWNRRVTWRLKGLANLLLEVRRIGGTTRLVFSEESVLRRVEDGSDQGVIWMILTV